MPSSTSIPLHLPRPARVRTATAADQRSASRSASGAPVEVDGRQVAQVRESWLVEDRWWTERPLRRRHWEVVTGCGRNIVVFRDLEPAGGWFVQR
jgi:hypothetical protein